MPSVTARLFNATNGAAAIAAGFEIGLLDELNSEAPVNIEGFSEAHGLHTPSIQALVHVLRCFDIVRTNGSTNVVQPGAAFDDTYREKGYFLWLVRGYGFMLQNLSQIVQNDKRQGNFMHRDGAYIAMAGRDYGSQFVDPYFKEMLARVPFDVAAGPRVRKRRAAHEAGPRRPTVSRRRRGGQRWGRRSGHSPGA